jgi:WD40 repeat protein
LLLRGDLDWIVMRCLEKDRTRRYDTANGLAMDIQRHLRNEPVVARPPSAAYLLHKLIRRHRLEFAATVAIGAVFVIGGIVSAWQAIRATRAEREQASLRETAQQAQISEAKLRRAAEIEAFAVRLQAYASDMNLVQQALAVDNLGRAQELLDRHRPLPGQRDLRGWEWRYLWQFCQSDALPVFSQKTISISSVTVSSDATWLAVAEGDNGGLSIWNLHSRKETRLSAGDGFVYAAFSPRTPLLAVSIVTGSTSTNRSHRVLLWNAATAQKVNEIELSEQCTKLAFSEDGRTLVTSGMGTKNQIAVWRVPDGKKLAAYSAPARVIFRQPSFVHSPLAITGDTRLAAYTSPDKKVRVIDLTAGQERWSADATNDRLVALAFSPDGRILVTSAGFSESDVRLWDVASGKELGRLEGHRGFVQAIVFWPDGKTLASASGDQTIRLWDVKTRALLKTLRGHKLEVHSLALFPDGRTLASGCKDGAVYLWDTAATRAGTAHVRLPKPIFAWQFAADSKSVVTVDPDGRIERWNGDMFETRSEAMEIGKIRGAESVQIITDPPMVAVGTSSGQAQVWDWAQRVRLWQFNASSEAVYPIKFLGNGTKLILAYGTERNELHTLHEWDLTTGKDIRFWAGLPNSRSFYVGFSSDERWCLMLGEGASKLYGLATGREINPNLNLSQPRSPALSPDGRLFATASAAAHVQLWDATTFREIAALSGFMKGLSSVAFSPDGQRLVTGGTGMEAVKLWDLESHSCVLTLEGKGSLFAKIAFSADGTVLGSLSNPGVLHLWRAPSWPEIEAAEKLAASSRAAQ